MVPRLSILGLLAQMHASMERFVLVPRAMAQHLACALHLLRAHRLRHPHRYWGPWTDFRIHFNTLAYVHHRQSHLLPCNHFVCTDAHAIAQTDHGQFCSHISRNISILVSVSVLQNACLRFIKVVCIEKNQSEILATPISIVTAVPT